MINSIFSTLISIEIIASPLNCIWDRVFLRYFLINLSFQNFLLAHAIVIGNVISKNKKYTIKNEGS